MNVWASNFGSWSVNTIYLQPSFDHLTYHSKTPPNSNEIDNPFEPTISQARYTHVCNCKNWYQQGSADSYISIRIIIFVQRPKCSGFWWMRAFILKLVLFKHQPLSILIMNFASSKTRRYQGYTHSNDTSPAIEETALLLLIYYRPGTQNLHMRYNYRPDKHRLLLWFMYISQASQLAHVSLWVESKHE